MKKLSFFLFLLISFFGIGCGDKSSSKSDNEITKQVAKSASVEQTSESKAVEVAAEAKQEEKPTEDKLSAAGPGERAIQRWQAMIELDWDKAYTFETPAFRESYTVKDLRSSYGNAVTWKKVQLLGVKQDEQNVTADVTIELTTLFLDAGGGEMMIPNVLNERWLKKDGQWWYIRK